MCRLSEREGLSWPSRSHFRNAKRERKRGVGVVTMNGEMNFFRTKLNEYDRKPCKSTLHSGLHSKAFTFLKKITAVPKGPVSLESVQINKRGVYVQSEGLDASQIVATRCSGHPWHSATGKAGRKHHFHLSILLYQIGLVFESNRLTRVLSTKSV